MSSDEVNTFNKDNFDTYLKELTTRTGTSIQECARPISTEVPAYCYGIERR